MKIVLNIMLVVLLFGCTENKNQIEIDGKIINDLHLIIDNSESEHVLVGLLDSIPVLVNTKTNSIIGKVYYYGDTPDNFRYGLSRFYDLNNEKIGLFNHKGEVILNPDYNEIIDFSDESNQVYILTRYSDGINSSYILDIKNNDTIGNPYWFDNGPDYFEDGLCRFKRNMKVGFLNEKGEVVIDPKYEFASYFKNGISKVGQNCKKIIYDSVDMHSFISCSKVGIINKYGEEVLPLIYDDIEEPKDSSLILTVTKNKESFEIDLTAYVDSLNKEKLKTNN